MVLQWITGLHLSYSNDAFENQANLALKILGIGLANSMKPLLKVFTIIFVLLCAIYFSIHFFMQYFQFFFYF